MLAEQTSMGGTGAGVIRRPISASPIVSSVRAPIAGNPIIQRGPTVPVRTPIAVRAPLSPPARGTIARPVGVLGGGTAVSTPALPPSGCPSRGTAIVSPGMAGAVSLSPQGGSGVLTTQPAGPPPSGAPPSMSLVTSTAGVDTGALPDPFTGSLAAPVAVGNFALPLGWILLAGVVVLVIFLARD